MKPKAPKKRAREEKGESMKTKAPKKRAREDEGEDDLLIPNEDSHKKVGELMERMLRCSHGDKKSLISQIARETREAVEESPVLALPHGGGKVPFLHYVLTFSTFAETEEQQEEVDNLMKAVIPKYPKALTMVADNWYGEGAPAIDLISRATNRYPLLVWIAENYPSSLDEFKELPLHTNMIARYIRGRDDSIKPAILRSIHEYFDKYPEGLKQSDEDYQFPLHHILEYEMLRNFNEADLNLIQYMIEQYPEAICLEDGSGWTPLHIACFNFAQASDDASSSFLHQIILSMMNQAPRAVLLVDETTPLTLLARKWAKPFMSFPMSVKERIFDTVILMLRSIYPKPLHAKDEARDWKFVQNIQSLLEEEADYSHNCVRIKTTEKIIEKKTVASDKSATSEDLEVLEIYSCWAKNHLMDAEAKIKAIREIEMVSTRTKGIRGDDGTSN